METCRQNAASDFCRRVRPSRTWKAIRFSACTSACRKLMRYPGVWARSSINEPRQTSGRVHPESLPEELLHGCLGRDLPGATEQCWNAGNRIDAQRMEDGGGELA